MGWSGKVAVITGAASGIGQALAVDLAKRGADVALCDVNDEGLAETVSRVERLGRRVISGHVDVSDRAAVEGFRDRVLSELGRADAIVNNAGVTVNQSVVDLTYEDFEWIMGINFWGVVYGTKAYLPHLLERDSGWVVNVSSVFGIIGYPYQSAYNATKFAVRGFTEALRHELAETGVTSLCVHPGGIKTNIVRSSRFRAAPGGVDKETAVKRFDTQAARTTAEGAAKIIADAMDAKKDRVLVGPDAYAIDAVQRAAPVGYGKLLAIVEKRARGEG
ncbi:MAG: SDR family oxidoreductase [Sandaracinaceae bacterium]|nr:SDR family oxidoreductase [Sandaracinaceae bacterium]